MLQLATQVWTIRELMKTAIQHLRNHGIPEPRLSVELLLAHALRCQRIELYSRFNRRLAKEELARFRALYERRLAREPVQYIIGKEHFMGLSFQVDRRVLIPRPETETLVEQAMIRCQAFGDEQIISILDVGAGSGNIAVSLAKFVKRSVVTSIDTSEAALDVARQNARNHGVEEKVLFLHLDLFEPIDQLLRRRFHLLVSNPPYISTSEWEHLQPVVRDYEPREALCDGADGYELYRRLIEIAPYLLLDGGTLFLEVGDRMAFPVLSLMHDAGFFDLAVVRDLQGIERVVAGCCHIKVRNSVPIN
jgi:release factor glutamine methyltransferase